MRKSFCIFLFTVALAAASAFGQAKTITAGEYEAVIFSAYDTSAKVPRRIVSVRKEYEAGAVSRTVETVTESQSPDNTRQLITEKKGDAVIKKTEIIQIKNMDYRRVNGGRWTKEDLSKGKFKLGSRVNSKSEHWFEEVTDGGEKLKVYTAQTRVDLETKITYYEQKIFVDDKGLIRKAKNSVMHNTKDNVVSEDTLTYEYNPKALKKITAPIK